MSAAHFQFPSACFFQTSRYLPRSLNGLPLASLILNSYVPLTWAMSPDFDASTLVGFQLNAKPGLARRSCHSFRIASFVVALGPFGGRTTASSESYAIVCSRFFAAAAFDHCPSRSRRTRSICCALLAFSNCEPAVDCAELEPGSLC